MAARNSTPGRLGDWITDRILRGLIALALALPYAARVRLMGWLMRRVIGPLAGYRRRARENLALIWPDMPPAHRNSIADAAIDNAGRTLIENYANRELAHRMAGARVQGDGLQALAAARAAGRPVIFVTGHFGNYEAPRHVLAAQGHVIGGLYRAMSNPFFNSHYAATMAGVSGPVFEKGRRGTMGFARFLKSGGMATILFDVHDSSGEMIPFLGRPAPTSTSAATLALRFDALLLPYFGIRQPDGLGFDILVEAPIAHSDPVTMTAAMTARLEAQIAAHPGQWFWVHRRWKPRRTRD
ncbi:MAG: lysophospholipid acyltransferase family protein [Rhodobacterales bacterium]|nr:lysophospholipid acyltransferase family protein [Rhodobacterales bacterium]NCT11987.1 lysophospholipid acyltransferase family protein [Rhodobacterales bacterium]